VAEEYLPGTLRTLETLGDGETTWLLGGFLTTVSAPPWFVEERLTWDPLPPGERRLRSLALALGLALLPWRAVPAAGLAPEPAAVPRSSRFT